MKPNPVTPARDVTEHLRKQAEQRIAAQKRLTAVDRRYREYMSGAKPS